MSCHDIFFVAHGGQVHALIPAQEEIEIDGDLLELRFGKRVRNEGRQQGRDS